MRDDDDTDDKASVAVMRFRIAELEKRQGKVENLILGFFIAVCTAVMGGVFALLKLPAH